MTNDKELPSHKVAETVGRAMAEKPNNVSYLLGCLTATQQMIMDALHRRIEELEIDVRAIATERDLEFETQLKLFKESKKEPEKKAKSDQIISEGILNLDALRKFIKEELL